MFDGEGMELLESVLREIYRMESDDVLDELDPNLLLNAWEARHHVMVARIMRTMAKANPNIEEYERFINDEDPGGRPETLRWNWRITRHDDGAVKDVLGHLSWSQSSRGDPQPFLPLVGQELEYAIRDAGGQY